MEEKKKCPLCSKKLEMKDGVPFCPDCGYRDPYRSGGDSPQVNNSQQPRMVNGGQGQANYSGQLKLGPYAAVVQPSGREEGNTAVVVIAVVMAVVVAIIIMGVSLSFFVMNRAYNEKLRETEWNSGSDGRWQSAPAASAEDDRQSSFTAGQNPGNVSHLTFEPPESQFLQEFVSQIFDKPAASVTREDLNSVISLEIRDIYDYKGAEIVYELSDGTAGSCYLSSSNHLKTGDFKCFPKLQRLDLGRNSLDWETDWHNMASLTSLACRASLKDLADCMDVSRLTSLELSWDTLTGGLDRLGEYSNLEYLRLDGNDYKMDLTGLAQASFLKTLIIEDGDGISDFEELYAMPQLKELSIESKGLRDIGFVSDMPGLESLELCSTQLKRIGAIADRADSLKCLRLHRNYSVEDYSAVFECTGLEELELYVDYDFDFSMVMPDLSMMPKLRILTLGNYESFPGLENMSELESLTLIDAGYFDASMELTGLGGLTGLKSLSLIDMSVVPEFLEAFADVPGLENLDLTDTFVWGDINAVFGMPNLKTLNLEDADFGLNLEGMPVSESLLELNLADTTIHQLKEDGSWDYGAGNTQISLGDYTEFFGHAPNLAVLEAPGHELQDVEFAGELSQLTYLNITDNYVTDLSPLAGLKQLKAIICWNNPVHDRTGLKNVIIIK